MYDDDTIMAFRLNAPQDQQPDPNNPVRYDHIFVNYGGYYQELDARDPAAAIRWHILKDYSVGREMDMSRRDHSAYVVSGVMDYDGLDSTRWTEPQAKFKFEVYPAPATFTAKLWVPDFIAKTGAAIMTISVNGRAIGATPLLRDGMTEVSFPVSAHEITRDGFTFVDINVANPWKDQSGIKYGVLLLKAGFTYR
jgi:hypothetical protein